MADSSIIDGVPNVQVRPSATSGALDLENDGGSYAICQVDHAGRILVSVTCHLAEAGKAVYSSWPFCRFLAPRSMIVSEDSSVRATPLIA